MLRPANFQAATRTPSPPPSRKSPKTVARPSCAKPSYHSNPRSTDRIIPDRIPSPSLPSLPHYSKGNFFFQRSKDPVQRRACTVLKLYTISRVYGIRHIAFPDKFEVIANYERQQLEHSRASARILLKFLSLYSNYSKRYSEERLKYNLNPCLDPLSSIIEPLSFLFFSLFFFSFSTYPIVSGKIASESIPER